MIRLVFKELRKHKIGITLLLLFWSISGYYIYENRNAFPVYLSRVFLFLPEEGSQDPETAYFDYIEPALSYTEPKGFWCFRMPEWIGGCSKEEFISKKIHLNIMEKACRKYSSSGSAYSPHWLESIQEWNISGIDEKKVQTVDPGEYWDENNDDVLLSLKKLMQASSYAWEIPEEVREDDKKGTLLVAELIAKHARAVCRYDLGLIAWGDYMEFIELRAGIETSKKDPESYRIYMYPAEKTLFALKSLKNNPDYLRALKEYSAGSASVSLLTGCRNAPLSLPCASPDEAIRVMNKMIYFSNPEDLPGIYIKLAGLHLTHNDPEKRKKALDYLDAARRYPGTKKQSLVLLIRYNIQNSNLKQSYIHLRELQAMLPDQGRYDADYRRLARAILMKDGKFKEADCFAEKAETNFGIREHCKKVRL